VQYGEPSLTLVNGQNEEKTIDAKTFGTFFIERGSKLKIKSLGKSEVYIASYDN
jgi:hypothetical protein